MKSTLLIYLPEGFADWEGSFLLPELRAAGHSFLIVTDEGQMVRSIGGLKVTPDCGLLDVDAFGVEGLVLIGSDSWADPKNNEKALGLTRRLLDEGKMVAAICGASNALARAGFLNERPHTGNDVGFLKTHVPEYKGERFFVSTLATTDKNLITASGIAPIEFAFEILKYLNLFSESYRKHWFEMYKHGVLPPVEFWSEQVSPE